MAVAENPVLRDQCEQMAVRAHAAADELVTITGEQKNRWLARCAAELRAQCESIVTANEKDVRAAANLSAAQVDRLKLTPPRIEEMAKALEQIAMLVDPVGEIIESSVRPNGLELQKVRVPLGVVLFIYESRPNVTVDAAALCVKSGNAVILRGGKEAIHSNRALAELLMNAAAVEGLPRDAVQLVPTTDREAVGHLLSLDRYISVAIPRGGESLIRRVAAEAKMPVIKHFTGNCHVYVDRSADLAMAERILINSKCQRPGVCNAAESLLVHADVAETFVPAAAAVLIQHGIEIRGDARICSLAPDAVQATEEDYRAEFLGPIISACVVDSLDDAIDHINRYGSQHTDAIVTTDLTAARRFAARVDTAAVMINASTRFNDGGQFGLGAEIGISTDKFHARGPCGLRELTTYKWVAYGDGQVRK